MLSDSFHGERQYDTPDCSLKAIIWILVVFPHLLLQIDCSHLFFRCPCWCMMCTYSGWIYIGNLKRYKLLLNHKREYSMEDSWFTPSHPSGIYRMPIPIWWWEFSPLSSCWEKIEYCRNNRSIIYSRLTTSLTSRAREEWFYNLHPRKWYNEISRKFRYFFHTEER